MNAPMRHETNGLMWPYYPELLEKPVPRYTSFPTAAEFGEAVDGEDQRAALKATRGQVSVYVHLPFCTQICWYCGCNTGAAHHAHRLSAYLDALSTEIAMVGRQLRKAEVTRIAFGGGSPNALTPTQFVRLVTWLTAHLRLNDPMWSVELDPRHLSREWGIALRHIGITRASLGVQTFSPMLQAAIGRVQPDAVIESGTRLLREAGVTSLNFDMMYGLPGQTREHLTDSLVRAVDLGADRIALFGYAHVPHLLPRQRRIDASALPGQAERFAMAAIGHDMLVDAGYVAVGFDHFARPGDALAQATVAGHLRRNFQGFTEDQAETVIGLGASSISAFPGVFVQNAKNAGRYREKLEAGEWPGVLGILRSPEDQLRGRIISALLCQGRADAGGDVVASVAPGLAPFIARGLVEAEAGVITILPAGLPYARSIAALFDPYRANAGARFSSAV